MKIIQINQSEFNAVCYSRNAHFMPLLEEVAYYKNDEGTIYGVIAKDRFDGDFGSVVLGRDANKRFRTIEPPLKFYDSPAEAFLELEEKFIKVHGEGSQVHPQGDETGKPNELYRVIAKEDKLHKLFIVLLNDPIYKVARSFIGEAVYAYVDVDGNYIKDFQSTGFNARLWELYLYIFLKYQSFEFDHSFHAPDYLIEKRDISIALEATTVNSDAKFDEPYPSDDVEAYRLTSDYLPIKFGSSLFSKLQKKYWELDHMKDRPFIIAIHDYHMQNLLPYAGMALRSYLYGVRYKTVIENGSVTICLDNKTLPIPEVIEKHKYKHKEIPSNFFNQPGAENVSAVLFCNNATIDTFNRYGKLAKMDGHSLVIVKISETTDFRSPTYNPKIISENIESDDYYEVWEDTMCIFHNPNASNPIKPDVFDGISQCFIDAPENRFYGPRTDPEFLRSYNRY